MNIKKLAALGMTMLAMVVFTAGCGSDTSSNGANELPKKWSLV